MVRVGRFASMDFAVAAVGMLGGVRFSIAAPRARGRRERKMRGAVNFIAVVVVGRMWEFIVG